MKLVHVMILAAMTTMVVSAQAIPVYHSQEEYCAANPSAVGCKDGRPVNVMEEMQKNMEAATTPMHQFCLNNPDNQACKNQTSGMVSNPQTAPATRVIRSEPLIPSAPRVRERAVSTHQSGALDWRLVQPQADLVLGLDVAALRGSALARDAITECLKSAGASAAESDRMLAGLEGLSRVVISVRQNQVLAALVGQLDHFPEGAQMGNLQSIRVSADTVVIGTRDALWGVSHRFRVAAGLSPSLAEARQLAQSNQVWFWGRPSALAGAGHLGADNSSVTKVRFGLNLRDDLRMDMILDTPDTAAAKRIVETFRNRAPVGTRSTVEGNAVHYVLVLDRAAVRENVAQLLASSDMKQLNPMMAAARQLAAGYSSPAGPPPGKIVIQGLDDGPREISLNPAQ